jgi:excisionase family DNA binding protein
VEYVLTKGESAAQLGITTVEDERLIASGRLPGLRTGYTVTVPSADVERLLGEG